MMESMKKMKHMMGKSLLLHHVHYKDSDIDVRQESAISDI